MCIHCICSEELDLHKTLSLSPLAPFSYTLSTENTFKKLNPQLCSVNKSRVRLAKLNAPWIAAVI